MNKIENSIVKSIGPNTCELCGGEIENGELYRYQSTVLKGVIDSFRCHIHCFELSEHFKMFDSDWDLDSKVFKKVVSDNYVLEFTITDMLIEHQAISLYEELNRGINE